MHFTYQKPERDADLQQGDILARTPELCEVIKQFHPYYLKNDYTHFIITTQSCDLVRRRGDEVAAKYVTLAAIRSLGIVLEREAERYRYGIILKSAKANGEKSKGYLRQFLARLLNNNHTEYFYLHEEPTLGLVDRSCAFLRLSISLRASEHYSVCQDAKVASLAPTFQPKLGWLVGNIYSRVGTEDWSPKHRTATEWKQLIELILDQSIDWLDEEKLKAANKEISPEQIQEMSESEIKDTVRNLEVPKKKNQVIDAVLGELVREEFLAEADVDKARLRLLNASTIASLLK